jgi:hypothetical protein
MFRCGDLQWLAFLIIILNILAVSKAASRSRGGGVDASEEFMHQRPDQQKSSPGWQEPGLWRPKWVMEREFVEQRGNGSEVVSRDRLYFRLKSDRTVKIFSRKSRPLLEWRRKAPREEEKKKKLFEAPGGGDKDSKQEEVSQAKQLQTFRAEQEALFESDGAWYATMCGIQCVPLFLHRIPLFSAGGGPKTFRPARPA